jgi:hypothetical protein
MGEEICQNTVSVCIRSEYYHEFSEMELAFCLTSFLSRNGKSYEAVAFENLPTDFDIRKIYKYHFPF